MFTQEELQKAAERLAAAGTPYFGKTLYEGEGHKVVVRPYFHGAVDKGLFYLLNVDESPYSDTFIISNMETGESEALQDYIEKVLPCEITHWEGKRKEAEREEKAARERAEHERFNGFTDNMTPMQKGRVVKCLDKMYRYKEEAGLDIQGGIMSRAVRMEQLYKAGCTVRTRKDAQGKTEYWVDVAPHRGYIVTKTEYEYFQFLESVTIPF